MSTSTAVLRTDVVGWRAWLAEHAADAAEAWLVLPRQDAVVAGPTYEQAVREALCFGWIDSTRRRHDERSSVLRFSPAAGGSTWSESNRTRVADLVAVGLMTPRGQREVNLAHERGTWEPDA